MIRMNRQTYKTGEMEITAVYSVGDTRGPGEVNFRSGVCWRSDSRYPGDWMVRRHETGGIEITYTGSQHNSKDIVKVIPPEQVDRFILSILECREWPDA